MPLSIVVTRDFEHLSDVAGEFVLGELRAGLAGKARYVLGLATGRSPTGLYRRLAEAANDGAFDPARVTSFNLDEYVGLPGENAQQRVLHPESYTFFMIQELFGRLRTKFAEANVPWGTLIDQARLEEEMRMHPADWSLAGTDAGKAVVIRPDASSEYLRWIRETVLDGYGRKIRSAGGIDVHVLGVGERGHVGFHEAGIPFEGSSMLLVQLDDNTRSNAVKDGHFAELEDSPMFAVSMGVELIFQARAVLLLADGHRKTEALRRGLLEKPGPEVPLSYAQLYASRGGRFVAVVDRVAGADLLARADAIRGRGWEIRDLSG